MRFPSLQLAKIPGLICFTLALAIPLGAQTPAARDASVVIESRQVRFSVRRAVEHLRLQIHDQAGEAVYDSGFVAEAEIAWAMRDGGGGELKGGLYAWTLTVKEAGEETARAKRGHFILDRAGQSDKFWVTSEGADGVGAEMNRNGNAAIAGIETRNETAEQAVAPERNKKTNASAGKEEAQQGAQQEAMLTGGSGTPGKIAKWTTATDLGDSVIVESGSGLVGIGNPSPLAKLDVRSGTAVVAIKGAAVSAGGIGVFGSAAPTTGNSIAVRGENSSPQGQGVLGFATADSGQTYGVHGLTRSPDGIGVRGLATATTGFGVGALGSSSSPEGIGVKGFASATTGINQGVFGQSGSSGGTGVHGHATSTVGSTFGVFGQSNSDFGTGVRGFTSSGTGPATGVDGRTSSTSGIGTNGFATATSGNTIGVYGTSASPTGFGVRGFGSSLTGSNYGVHGVSNSANGTGVYGRAAGNTSNLTIGVWGESASANGYGVFGFAGGLLGQSTGVFGQTSSTNGRGVFGFSGASSGVNYGVYGWANSPAGYGGYFQGRVHVNGSLSKSSGSFKIDHPLDPENKYLYHSFVESPDMMNIYNGLVTIGEDGTAEVTLPDWFEALNREFRYQLTCIGGFAPVYVAEKVRGNQFKIAGGQPGLEVSWQLTGIRKDAFAEQNRIPVEELKPAEERGFYLHPEVFGKPAEKHVEWARDPKGMLRMKEAREPKRPQ